MSNDCIEQSMRSSSFRSREQCESNVIDTCHTTRRVRYMSWQGIDGSQSPKKLVTEGAKKNNLSRKEEARGSLLTPNKNKCATSLASHNKANLTAFKLTFNNLLIHGLLNGTMILVIFFLTHPFECHYHFTMTC